MDAGSNDVAFQNATQLSSVSGRRLNSGSTLSAIEQSSDLVSQQSYMSYSKTPKSNVQIGQKLLTWFSWFLTCARTERALRTTAFFVPALLCTYYQWIHTNFSYASALLYLLMAALLPPMICGVSIVGTMAFSAGVLGMAYVSAIWAVGIKDGVGSPECRMYLMFGALVILVAPWKVGKTAGVTAMGALMAVYVSELAFFSGFSFIRNGARFLVPWTWVDQFVEKEAKAVSDFIAQLPSALQQIAKLIIQALKMHKPFPPASEFNITIPASIAVLEPDLAPLIGLNVTVGWTNQGITAYLPPSLWFINMAWTATGKLGLVRAILSYGGVALACFVASLLITPQRYIRSFLRQSVARLTRNEVILQTVLDASSLMTPRMRRLLGFPSLSYNPSQILNPVEETLTMEAPGLINSEPIRYSFSSSLTPALQEASETSRLQNRSPKRQDTDGLGVNTSEEKLASKTHTLPQNILPPVDVYDTLREEILAVRELHPMVSASAFEPSVSNPGLFVWFMPKWNPVINAVGDILIHTYGFWDLILINPTAAIGNLDVKTAPHLNNVFYLRKSYKFFEKAIVSAIELYRLNGLIIGLHPVSRGAQLESFRCLRGELQKRLAEHRNTEMLFLKHSILRCELGFSSAISWTNAVLRFGAMFEFSQVILRGPISLSQRTDMLIEASTEQQRFANLFINLFAFFMPLAALAASLVRNLVRIFTPWTWVWRRNRSNTGSPYLFTMAPWYRRTDVAFCLRWIVGIMCAIALPMFSQSYRTWIISDGDEAPSLLTRLIVDPLASKVSSWTSLAYLTTIFMTVEGTVHRAGLRVIGVLTGSTCGYICLRIFGTSNKVGQIIWLIITTFAVCWIGGNPSSALLGYHPSWGYACQLFTYQQAIIVIEAFSGVQTANELVSTRLVAHVIGIGLACILSFLFFPNQANISVRLASAQVLHCNTQAVLAVAESLLVADADVDVAVALGSTVSHPVVTELRPVEPKKPNSFSASPHHTLFKRPRTQYSTIADNPTDLAKNALQNPQAKQLVQKLLHRIDENKILVNEGIDAIQTLLKDCSVFREIPIHTLQTRWFSSVHTLHLLSARREAIANVIRSFPQPYGHLSHKEFRPVLKTINQLSDVLEQFLIKNRGTSWFTGYNWNLCTGFFSCCSCAKRRRAARDQTTFERLQQSVTVVRTELQQNWEALGSTYPAILSKIQRCDTSDKPEEISTDLLCASFSLPPDVWAWLALSYLLLKYVGDLMDYMATLAPETLGEKKRAAAYNIEKD